MATSEPIRDRVNQIRDAINQVFEDCSGVELSQYDDETTFFEMGLDSLVLTQIATAINKAFDIEVTFRQLLEEVCNPSQLVAFLDEKLPADRFAMVAATTESTARDESRTASQKGLNATEEHDSPNGNPMASNLPMTQPIQPQESNAAACEPGVQAIIGQQLQLMSRQLALLSAGPLPDAQLGAEPKKIPAASRVPPMETKPAAKPPEKEARSESEAVAKSLAAAKPFGAAARVTLSDESLSEEQQSALSDLIDQQCRKMPGSKAYAQKHRSYLADPRTVSGFRPSIKEMTFPLVVERSKGVHLWDVDGNQYIDMTCGFGSNFLGHSHPIVVEAIQRQAETDFSIGPQSDLAGPVAEIFRSLTGHERMAYANTGSEAVLGATRLARTFTGNDRIVMFNQDYHGILDEVIVRSSQKQVSFPAATGIPRSHVENTLVLDYGSDAALQVIADQLDELAAVVVEPVQSRNPSLQPTAFLKELERITSNHKTALIFDEVITGFRIAPGGAGQHFGVRADLAAYGKVVGGGMPIGIIAGKADYMNGLDGGNWQFGDDSRPTAGMTYFAGTFVRHPITLAASHAILQHIRDGGQAIYDRLNALTSSLAERTNKLFDELGVPMQFAHFGSLFKIQFNSDVPYSELLFAGLRRRGIHIWDARPCLMTLAHQGEHVDQFLSALRDCLIELIGLGFMPTSNESMLNQPASQQEARLGKTRDGNPGWFVPDQSRPGQFVQVPQPKS